LPTRGPCPSKGGSTFGTVSDEMKRIGVSAVSGDPPELDLLRSVHLTEMIFPAPPQGEIPTHRKPISDLGNALSLDMNRIL
jgi:hypothetical protein